MGNTPCAADWTTGSGSLFAQSPSPPISVMVDRKIQSSEILMVSKSKCPACKSAKQLFRELYKELGVWPTIVELDQYDRQTYTKIVDHLQTKTRIRTVPQIFFQGTFVGGNDDVQRLRRQRALIRKYRNSKSLNGISLPQSNVAPNIIRLSPVFNYTMPKIRTEPVFLEPTQIKNYMATTSFPTNPSMAQFPSNSTLSPTFTSPTFTSPTQVFSATIHPRPAHRGRTMSNYTSQSFDEASQAYPRFDTREEKTEVWTQARPRTRHQRSMSAPAPAQLSSTLYNSRYNSATELFSTEYNEASSINSFPINSYIIEEPMEIKLATAPRRQRNSPVLTSPSPIITSPVIMEEIEFPSPQFGEIGAGDVLNDEFEYQEYDSSSSETADLLASAFEVDNPNSNNQIPHLAVEEIIDVRPVGVPKKKKRYSWLSEAEIIGENPIPNSKKSKTRYSWMSEAEIIDEKPQFTQGF